MTVKDGGSGDGISFGHICAVILPPQSQTGARARAPLCRYFSQRDPVGGRVVVIDFRSDEDERKFDRMRVEDETFAKFRDEWEAKYSPESFVVMRCDEIMQDTIKEIESKYT